MQTSTSQQNLKQYFVKDEYHPTLFKRWPKGSVILLGADEAFPLVNQRILLPLYTAIKEGLYPPKVEETNIVRKIIAKAGATKKAKTALSSPAATQSKPMTPVAEIIQEKGKSPAPQKRFLENQLRQIIQAKKARKAVENT